jgi:hypothetical protein
MTIEAINKEKNERKINLANDTTFKFLIKNKRTRNWYYEIIKYFTNIDLNNYILVDNELNTGNKIKDYRMDIVFKFNDSIILLEMNNGNRFSQTIKAYQYLYRTECRDFFEGETYKLNYTTLIMFNNFRNEECLDLKYIYCYLGTHKYDKYDIRIKGIDSYEIYLPNYDKKDYNKYNLIEKRLCLFGCKDIEEMKSIVKDKDDENQIIIKELERLEMDEQFLYAYDNAIVQKNMMRIEATENYNKGFDKGKREDQIAIARNLRAMNMKTEDISKATGLSVKEIENILKEKA